MAKLAVIVSLETKDNSESVKTFGKQLSMHIAASNPLALDQNSIDQSIIDKEQELVTEELKNSGKPETVKRNGMAAIIATHNTEFASKLDRIIRIESGKLV